MSLKQSQQQATFEVRTHFSGNNALEWGVDIDDPSKWICLVVIYFPNYLLLMLLLEEINRSQETISNGAR